MAATFGGGLSIFLILTGVGTALVGSPLPAWMPSHEAAAGRWLWSGGLTIAGVAMVPLWWRWGFGVHSEPSPAISGTKMLGEGTAEQARLARLGVSEQHGPGFSGATSDD